MSGKIKEIWENGIGSVHGADVTTSIAVSTASNLAVHAMELQDRIKRADAFISSIDREEEYLTWQEVDSLCAILRGGHKYAFTAGTERELSPLVLE